jgi:lysyl-tRNA synthetase class 2
VTKTIELKRPWRRVTYKDLIKEKIRPDWFDLSFDQRVGHAIRSGIDFGQAIANELNKFLSLAEQSEQMSKMERQNLSEILPKIQLTEFEVTQAVFEKFVEPTLIQPTFVTHLPKELVPLAKLSPDDPTTVEVFELCINGQEIAPGYTEQNNPIEQRERLEHQAGGEQQKLDEDFLIALEHGMPPAGGIGIGIDRLCMMLLGQESIRDVILFPQLKPK